MFPTVAENRQSVRLLNRLFCLIGIVIGMTCVVPAEEQKSDAKGRAEVLATQRLELMQKRVTAAQIKSEIAGFPKQIAAKPIFKYSDPARGYVAAAVWKLGDQGRPRALLATELNPKHYGRPFISYELISLTSAPFSLSSQDIKWSPSRTLYQFKPIRNAPAPEKTAPRRLIQLREIAKRFASNEEVDKEKCELRLLPQPVDRYTPSDVDRADGAIFLFTFGTNPEVVLLIESDGKTWSYAAGRMTGAEVVVLTLDNELAWQGAPLQKGPESPFTGSIAPVDIPGIAADGSELP